MEKNRLIFGRMAGTLMACQHAMDQEHRMLSMLPTITRYQIEGERLRLFNTTDEVVAEFESHYIQ